MAPSTPPPPANWLFAALTMASVVCRVISPVTSSSTHAPICTCIPVLLVRSSLPLTGSLDCSTMSSHVPGTAGGGERGVGASAHLALVLMFPSTVECDAPCCDRQKDQTIMDETQYRHLTALPGTHGTVYNA